MGLSMSPIIVALDYPTKQAALDMAQQLDPEVCRVKVGKELFTSCGPAIVEELQQKNFEVFLDLKFHDIPTTTAKAVRAAANLGVWMVNVHASGGQRMLAACREAIDKSPHKPLLIAVTVLTSMDSSDFQTLGYTTTPEEYALALAKLSYNCGVDGIVCSAFEASSIKNHTHKDFLTVTPGIRLKENSLDDQRRIMTPVEAVKNNADYLVIGRPVTQAKSPSVAVQNIVKELFSF
ncbi:orotidine-5'-phosphate decarboxylase [Zooshikella ganghwensis]|uniref:Orotidine 5'-phosphate decarboxylase n=1 Tax=Zooshikella ganghwensis TaxID=202772 RepID=A0A4V1INB5_9GAMM|nr:orotidine-5'-phosphate decarboxylase [Zooshikella ganghwensis]